MITFLVLENFNNNQDSFTTIKIIFSASVETALLALATDSISNRYRQEGCSIPQPWLLCLKK